MPYNHLIESGLIVTFEADPQAALKESGLIVAFQSEPYASIVESGLILTYQAEPIHRFKEAGLIIVHEEQGIGTEPVLIQGEEIIRDYFLQGQAMEEGPFFSDPD